MREIFIKEPIYYSDAEKMQENKYTCFVAGEEFTVYGHVVARHTQFGTETWVECEGYVVDYYLKRIY